jgi:hypothetical protein
MAMALPPHWVLTPMKYRQSDKRGFSVRLIPLLRAREGPYPSIGSSRGVRLGKRLGVAGFYFFMAKGMFWLIGFSFVFGFGL